MLTDLRDHLVAELERQGKTAWAAEEFAALVASADRPPRGRPDPWGPHPGIHRGRGPPPVWPARAGRRGSARTRGAAPPGSTGYAAPAPSPGCARSGTPGTAW